jgi:hypothetical protein
MIPQPTFTENGTDPGNYDAVCYNQQGLTIKPLPFVYGAKEMLADIRKFLEHIFRLRPHFLALLLFALGPAC